MVPSADGTTYLPQWYPIGEIAPYHSKSSKAYVATIDIGSSEEVKGWEFTPLEK
jgi:hypothetical protein